MEDLITGSHLENDTRKTESVLHAEIAQYEEAEKFCIQLISEFLQSYGLVSTLQAFTKECTELGYVVPLTTEKDRIKKESLLKILEHFAHRNLNNFFDAWQVLVPPSIQEKLECKKLTFYLHIHFAVLPLRKRIKAAVLDGNASIQSGDTSTGQRREQVLDQSEQLQTEEMEGESETDDTHGMEVLRHFLDSKGTEFSAEPEFLPYYALPFVSDPVSHPSFQELFMESWVKRLTGNLRDFLVNHSWGSAVAPRLLKLGLEAQCNTAHKAYAQLLEANRNLKQLKRRYQRLYKDHHNLLGVAAELTGALENSVKGQAVDLKATLDNCTKIFPDLFTKSPGTEQQSEATPEDAICRPVPQSQEDHPAIGFDLDFHKIKWNLSCGSMKTKLLLFQALRWRITKSPPEDRDLVVASYFRRDILSLHHSPQPSPVQLPLSAHFNPTHASTPHPLQQAAARLVNTVASLRCGRDYLCSAGSGVLRVLVHCLQGDKGIKIDDVTADMILATLQKLSLRHSQRVGMIELGLVEWLIKHLSANMNAMKAYTLEYSTALLMNLCLHRSAKERCVPVAKTVLKLLITLLGTKMTQAIPYVNGALYSLLAHPQINDEAKHMGLCDMLEFYLKNSDGEMSKQLEYILKLHRGHCQPDHSSTSDQENGDDDMEEMDLLEEELDSNDPVHSLHGELSGDQLLYQQYRLVFPYHGVVHTSSSSTAQSAGDVVLRPTTPRLHSLGSSEGKYVSYKSATSMEPSHHEKNGAEVSETCSKMCDSVILESL
ncbi:LisH domain-containing protein ARMC9, partial [Cryptotermes secundus]